MSIAISFLLLNTSHSTLKYIQSLKKSIKIDSLAVREDFGNFLKKIARVCKIQLDL